MNRLRVLLHLVRADFLERARRFRFLLALGAILLGGYLLVPPIGASYMVGLHPVELNTLTYWRSDYNSAWVGSIVAAMTGWLLSLLGFFLVKGAIERDRRTGVGQLLAASPLSGSLYILGKWLSNVAVLLALTGTMAVAAGAMQLIRGEEMRLQLTELLAPFLWLALPPLFFVAALAILFEVAPGLHGGVGNAVYALAWLALLPVSFNALSGLDCIETDVLAALQGAHEGGEFSASVGVNPAWYGAAYTFRWDGIPWTPVYVAQRMAWLGAAVLVLGLSAAVFRYSGAALENGLRRRTLQGRAILWSSPDPYWEAASATAAPPVSLAPLPVEARRASFHQALRAELRLGVSGLPWWWYPGAFTWAAGGLLAPTDVSRQYLLPVAWIWPLLIWSAMGTREIRHRTEGIVFSSAHPLRRHLPAIWLSGVIVALLAGSGAAMKLLIAGDWPAVSAWAVGALFVPTLALALGVWTGSGKAFECVYPLLWYAGPLSRLTALDFMGVTDKSIVAGMPYYYLALTFLLAGLALVGRGRQIRR